MGAFCGAGASRPANLPCSGWATRISIAKGGYRVFQYSTPRNLFLDRAAGRGGGGEAGRARWPRPAADGEGGCRSTLADWPARRALGGQGMRVLTVTLMW